MPRTCRDYSIFASMIRYQSTRPSEAVSKSLVILASSLMSMSQCAYCSISSACSSVVSKLLIILQSSWQQHCHLLATDSPLMSPDYTTRYTRWLQFVLLQLHQSWLPPLLHVTELPHGVAWQRCHRWRFRLKIAIKRKDKNDIFRSEYDLDAFARPV